MNKVKKKSSRWIQKPWWLDLGVFTLHHALNSVATWGMKRREQTIAKTRASNSISEPVPCQSPLLNVPGVGMLMGVRRIAGVEGTDKEAWTAVSVLSASRGVLIGVLGFSCFCCTASSCRRSVKETTQSKRWEYVATKIKTGGYLSLKRFFSSWRRGKVTYACRRLIQAYLQNPDN